METPMRLMLAAALAAGMGLADARAEDFFIGRTPDQVVSSRMMNPAPLGVLGPLYPPPEVISSQVSKLPYLRDKLLVAKPGGS